MDEETRSEQAEEEAGRAVGAGGVEAAASAGKSKKMIAGSIVVAVVALAAIGGGVALAMQPKAEAPAAQAEQSRGEAAPQVAQKADRKSELVVTVKADGIGEGATKAKIVVKDKDGKDSIGEREVAGNEQVSLGELAKGEYSLYVTAAPVCADGSTYRLPDAASDVKVEGEGEQVEIEVVLAKLPKEEMTKEQLEAASAVLAGAGDADAAAQAQRAVQAAPSGGSADAGDGSAASATGGGRSEGGSDGGSSEAAAPPAPKPDPAEPSDPNAGKTQVWVADYEMRPKYEQQWVPKWEQVPDYNNPSFVYYCSDCGIDFSSDTDFLNHDYSHHTGSRPVYPMVSVDNGSMQSVHVGDERVEVGGHWEWR